MFSKILKSTGNFQKNFGELSKRAETFREEAHGLVAKNFIEVLRISTNLNEVHLTGTKFNANFNVV